MNLKRLAISFFPWLCSLAMLSSCMSDPLKIDEAASAAMIEEARSVHPLSLVPEIVVEYYPYPVIPDVAVGSNSEIYPTPRYYGWIDDRMQRDAERISGYGIDAVMIQITPDELIDASFLDRLNMFYEYCISNRLRTIICLVPPKGNSTPLSLSINNLCRYVSANYIMNKNCSYMIDGRYLVVLDPRIAVSDNTPIEGFVVMYKSAPLSTHSEEAQFEAPFILEARIVSNSFVSRTGSVFKKLFFDALTSEACSPSPSMILLHSWNYYEDGSVLEPNTKDSDSLARFIKSCKEAISYQSPTE